MEKYLTVNNWIPISFSSDWVYCWQKQNCTIHLDNDETGVFVFPDKSEIPFIDMEEFHLIIKHYAEIL